MYNPRYRRNIAVTKTIQTNLSSPRQVLALECRFMSLGLLPGELQALGPERQPEQRSTQSPESCDLRKEGEDVNLGQTPKLLTNQQRSNSSSRRLHLAPSLSKPFLKPPLLLQHSVPRRSVTSVKFWVKSSSVGLVHFLVIGSLLLVLALCKRTMSQDHTQLSKP